jgi:hypothetical protein
LTNLYFLSFAFIEGINATQNPFTNNKVICSWIIITIFIIIMKFLEKY